MHDKIDINRAGILHECSCFIELIKRVEIKCEAS